MMTDDINIKNGLRIPINMFKCYFYLFVTGHNTNYLLIH